MKTKNCWVVFLLSLIVANSVFAAPLNQAQTKAMKVAYALQDKSLKAKNLDALMAQTDVSFQRKTSSGRIQTGRALEREYEKAGFQKVKSFDAVRTTIQSSNFAAQKIVIVAQTSFSGIFRNAKGEWQKQAFTTSSRDTWIPTRSGWRIRMTEELI